MNTTEALEVPEPPLKRRKNQYIHLLGKVGCHHCNSEDNLSVPARVFHEQALGCQEPLAAIPVNYMKAMQMKCPPTCRGIETPCGAAVQEWSELVGWDWEWQMFDNPIYGSQAGYHGHDDQLQEISPESFAVRAAHADHLRELIASMSSIQDLPPAARLHVRLLDAQAEEERDAIRIGAHLVLPINTVGHGGIVFDLMEAVDWVRKSSRHDFDMLRRRLELFPAQVTGMISLLQASIEAGFRPPTCVIESLPAQLRTLIGSLPSEISELCNMPSTQRQQRELREAVELGWVVGLTKLLGYIESTYIKSCTEAPGLCAQPRGTELYAAYLRYQTTASLSPSEIHNLGLEEVRRLRLRLVTDVFDPLGHKGNAMELAAKLKDDSQHFWSTAEELIDGYNKLNQCIAKHLPRFFKDMPKAELEVIARNMGPAGIYVAGTPDGKRSGHFYANVEPLCARPKYEQPAFALHECSPGHHFQNSLCLENEGLPAFLRMLEERRYEWCPARRQAYSAYQEGWGLYCESLGEEMGSLGEEGAVYKTVYDIFGYLSMEMKRAVRLVVDTGIHSLGWSFERAVEYMKRETGMHAVECERECRRYCAWPAQACAYKIGQLRFKQLRHHAEQQLGDRFDIRWFHHQCLRHGPLPLDMLQEVVEAAVDVAKRSETLAWDGHEWYTECKKISNDISG
eukprot:TRINITY_DN43016_c0_g1_i1.p1 TRINITY_DN43016_c0_g1~~TRINITY_DN43016_c0_g1_i1.p1  ORF type:complete len:682 (-),score=94.76 TRINITY_DN43016_c0_g1_i1:67-2112(-)